MLRFDYMVNLIDDRFDYMRESNLQWYDNDIYFPLTLLVKLMQTFKKIAISLIYMKQTIYM